MADFFSNFVPLQIKISRTTEPYEFSISAKLHISPWSILDY